MLTPEAGGEGVIMSVRVGAIVSMAVRVRPSCSIWAGVSDGMGSFDKGRGCVFLGGHKNNPHVFIPGCG